MGEAGAGRQGCVTGTRPGSGTALGCAVRCVPGPAQPARAGLELLRLTCPQGRAACLLPVSCPAALYLLEVVQKLEMLLKNLSPTGISLKFLVWEDATEPTLRAFLREGVNSLLHKPDPALGGWQGVARCGRRAHALCLTSGLNLSCLEVRLDCAGRL